MCRHHRSWSKDETPTTPNTHAVTISNSEDRCDDLPLTEWGNGHVVVIQDVLTKWPFVFPVPDQRVSRIARLLAEEVTPGLGCLNPYSLTEASISFHTPFLTSVGSSELPS